MTSRGRPRTRHHATVDDNTAHPRSPDGALLPGSGSRCGRNSQRQLMAMTTSDAPAPAMGEVRGGPKRLVVNWTAHPTNITPPKTMPTRPNVRIASPPHRTCEAASNAAGTCLSIEVDQRHHAGRHSQHQRDHRHRDQHANEHVVRRRARRIPEEESQGNDGEHQGQCQPQRPIHPKYGNGERRPPRRARRVRLRGDWAWIPREHAGRCRSGRFDRHPFGPPMFPTPNS